MSDNPALLDQASEFEPGFVDMPSLAQAQTNRDYVDRGFIHYQLSESAPWVFTLLYGDGGVLGIPLELMSFEALTGATMMLFRRHKRTGRLVPFQMLQDDPRLKDASLKSLPWQEVILRTVPPRFDTLLTPTIMGLVNEQQIVFMTVGFLKVLQLQLMNPIAFGWSPAAAEGTASQTLGRLALRRGASRVAADATAVGEKLLAETASVSGPVPRLLECARRLSSVRGLSAQVKADLLETLAKKLGLEVGGQAIKQGGRILLVAMDGRTALQIAADGAITFGKFSTKTMDIVEPTVLRAWKP